MTYSELKEYRTLKSDELFYNIEVNRLKLLLDEKITYYSSPSLDGMPSGGTQSPTERIAISKLEYGAEIQKQIAENKAKRDNCRARLKAIDEFIENIADSEARAYMRKHIKHNVPFNQLARENFVSRHYVTRKIYSNCEK